MQLESKNSQASNKIAICTEIQVEQAKRVSPADDAMCKLTLGVIPVSLLGLPMIHVLVVTHLFGCVEIEMIALFLSMHGD